ncbi:hypothetical protein GI482_16985 [Bacillus sp. N3536]|nr:hypothetical protein GI482_16985 [Bacillus sp. N3536]
MAAIATWSLPLPGKIIALIINYFIPEGVPFIDEIIQIVGIFKSVLSGFVRIFEWVQSFAEKIFAPFSKIFKRNSNY